MVTVGVKLTTDQLEKDVPLVDARVELDRAVWKIPISLNEFTCPFPMQSVLSNPLAVDTVAFVLFAKFHKGCKRGMLTAQQLECLNSQYKRVVIFWLGSLVFGWLSGCLVGLRRCPARARRMRICC